MCSSISPCSYLKLPYVFFITSRAYNSAIQIRKVMCLGECSTVIRKCMHNAFTRTCYTFTVVGTCLLLSSHFVRLKEVKLKGKKQALGVGEEEVEGVLLFGSVNYEAFLFYLISLFLWKLPIALARWFKQRQYVCLNMRRAVWAQVIEFGIMWLDMTRGTGWGAIHLLDVFPISHKHKCLHF